MPKTSQITQSELETCFALHRASNTLMFLLGEKLDNGATIEPGHYTIEGHLSENLRHRRELAGFSSLGITIKTDLALPDIFMGDAPVKSGRAAPGPR